MAPVQKEYRNLLVSNEKLRCDCLVSRSGVRGVHEAWVLNNSATNFISSVTGKVV